ncbi:MAG TPA: hypothetical protein VH307_00055 [Streptosporangiaceae bacterium]|nr:hypothetical protein [Streptosporangiaceae bacterium]
MQTLVRLRRRAMAATPPAAAAGTLALACVFCAPGGAGNGLLLAASARHVVAFRA